ncbi:unnamed protein product [marine sediment metagenome]|uniref:Uncharacterized protein n=1 Tax=marine sediment metagenome TaxID=412755 RepID=X1G782_9ZZZZ
MTVYLGVEEVLRQLNREEWRFRRKHLSDGTTPLDIKSDKVKRGWKRTVQRVSVEVDTIGCSEIRIGYIDKLDVIDWHGGQWRPQEGVLYTEEDPVVLQAGDRLLVRFIDSEDGNNLSIYAEGFEQEVA